MGAKGKLMISGWMKTEEEEEEERMDGWHLNQIGGGGGGGSSDRKGHRIHTNVAKKEFIGIWPQKDVMGWLNLSHGR